jgi:hypothetical protein
MALTIRAFVVAAVVVGLLAGGVWASSEAVFNIEWETAIAKSSAVPTLQVIAGPLLGTRRAPANVTARLWGALAAL